MKELIDLYDENRNKLNKAVERENYCYQNGEYRLIVDAIIINNKNEILITRRSKERKYFPLMWECNGGCSRSGEKSEETVVREVAEEIGINVKIEEGKLLLTENGNHKIRDVYVFHKNVDIKDLKFTDGEVCDAKYVTIEEFEKMYKNNEIVKSDIFIINNYKKIVER